LKNTQVVVDAISAATGGGGGGGTPINVMVYRRDLVQKSTVRVSSNNAGTAANGTSTGVALSADGMLVAFSSEAANLACQGDTNAAGDVFLRDLNAAAPPCGASTSNSSGGGGGGIWGAFPWLVMLALLGLCRGGRWQAALKRRDTHLPKSPPR
jgi:hypothetical protein